LRHAFGDPARASVARRRTACAIERNVESAGTGTLLHGAADSPGDRFHRAARLPMSESSALVRAGRAAPRLDRTVKEE
jgi:hypothetical protein